MTVEELRDLINFDDYVKVDVKIGNKFYKISNAIFEKDEESISLTLKDSEDLIK